MLRFSGKSIFSSFTQQFGDDLSFQDTAARLCCGRPGPARLGVGYCAFQAETWALQFPKLIIYCSEVSVTFLWSYKCTTSPSHFLFYPQI